VEGKISFSKWMKNYNLSEEEDWMIPGDFNMIRSPEVRNRPGGTLMRCSDLIQPLAALV